MKYVVFLISLILLVLIGAFLWSSMSSIFSGDFSLLRISDLSETSSNSPSGDSPSESQPGTVDTQPPSEPVSQEEDSTPPVSSREGVVFISSYDRSSFGDDPQDITLGTRLNQGESVNITDWKIRTNGSEVSIPGGVNFFEISEINDESDIVLRSGDRVRIYFEERPVPENLRLNKCTGYLNNIYDLGNFFPERCPKPDTSSYKHLSGRCQSAIRDLRTCEIPSTELMGSFSGSSDQGSECREFLRENFNAGWCYENHGDDPDFLDSEWRVWIDESRVLDSSHDWIRLINTQGEVIDDLNY